MADHRTKRLAARSPLMPLAVIVVGVVTALALWFWAVGEMPEVAPAQTENTLARDRPTGAGTAPEAPADRLVGEELPEGVVQPAPTD